MSEKKKEFPFSISGQETFLRTGRSKSTGVTLGFFPVALRLKKVSASLRGK